MFRVLQFLSGFAAILAFGASAVTSLEQGKIVLLSLIQFLPLLWVGDPVGAAAWLEKLFGSSTIDIAAWALAQPAVFVFAVSWGIFRLLQFRPRRR